jgi:hypothetical protein
MAASPPFDIVFLDTTVLFADLSMSGVHFRILFAGIKHHNTQLMVSQVTLDEAARHFGDRRQKAVDDLRNAYRELLRIGEGSLGEPNVDVFGFYPFHDPARWQVTPTVLPYPEVTHETLVERDLSRRKPFTEKGKGYRDALIWLSLVEALGRADGPKRVAIVTGNSKDFADAAGNLHSDLAWDLGLKGALVHAVTLFASLDQLTNQHVLQALPELEQMRIRLETGKYADFDLRAWLEGHIHALIPFHQLRGVSFADTPTVRWNLRFANYERLITFTVSDVRQVEDGLIRLRVTAHVTVSFCIRDPRALVWAEGDDPYEGPGTQLVTDSPLAVTVDLLYDSAKRGIGPAQTLELSGSAGRVELTGSKAYTATFVIE